MAIILSTCIANRVIINQSNNQELYRKRITASKASKTNLTRRSYCFTQHMYLYFNSYLDSQLAVFYFLLHDHQEAFKYAIQCIQHLQTLAQLQKKYLMWWQINILECVTKIRFPYNFELELVEFLESLLSLPENGLKLQYALINRNTKL